EVMDKAALLSSKKELKRWIIIFSVVWCIAMAITAVICLKDKSSETLQDFIIGVSISIPPLGFVTWLFFRMKRFLDEDSATVKDN
ncbi:hypothetical protein N9059_01950, partial [bacterium]|nr:hypothetical protein [bacterium]